MLRRNVIDLGKVKGNLAGDWAPGLEEPVGVFSNLEPEKALEIYRSRMKMEPSFRDLKGLLGLEKGMSKKLGTCLASGGYEVSHSGGGNRGGSRAGAVRTDIR